MKLINSLLSIILIIQTVSGNPVSEETTIAPTIFTSSPATDAPTTHAPTTHAPTTHAPTTHAPTTHAPTTHAPTTHAPTTTDVPTTTRKPYHSTFTNYYCDNSKCVGPNCRCLSDLPPNGTNPESIPQFVMITFDGAITVTNFPHYQELFNFENPNKCPIRSTYFVSHVDTNYKLVHELHRHGNEIGVHSVSKSKNNYQDYWRNLNLEGWESEFTSQMEIISKYAEIPKDEIVGARAPNLQTAGNITFTAFQNSHFEYDSSMPSRKGIESPFFPYTFDYGFQRFDDCQVQPCLKRGEQYTGFWDIPMNDWDVEYEIDEKIYHRECASAYACILFNKDGSVNSKPTSDQIYNLFEYNFERFYYGNRAPFPLFLNEEWIHDEEKREGLKRFIKEKTSKYSDVYFVSMHDVINWMKEPTTANEYLEKHRNCKPIEKTKCGLKDGQKVDDITLFKRTCEYKQVGELYGQNKRMVICDDLHCPTNYPWVNRIE